MQDAGPKRQVPRAALRAVSFQHDGGAGAAPGRLKKKNDIGRCVCGRQARRNKGTMTANEECVEHSKFSPRQIWHGSVCHLNPYVLTQRQTELTRKVESGSLWTQ